MKKTAGKRNGAKAKGSGAERAGSESGTGSEKPKGKKRKEAERTGNKAKAEWNGNERPERKQRKEASEAGAKSEAWKRTSFCTLKTAQPDGKTSCKETSCECVRNNARAQKCEQFCSWSQEKRNYQRLRNQSFDSYSD